VTPKKFIGDERDFVFVSGKSKAPAEVDRKPKADAKK